MLVNCCSFNSYLSFEINIINCLPKNMYGYCLQFELCIIRIEIVINNYHFYQYFDCSKTVVHYVCSLNC